MTRSRTPGSDFEPDSGFLTRWSRLKQASGVVENEAANENALGTGGSGENAGPSTGQDSAARPPTDADMPPVDSLTPDSDYTGFLSPGVSDALRKRALKKLFLSEVFNVRDGLDEYDDDFTQFEKLGDIVTADMRHQLEMQARREAEKRLQHEDRPALAGDTGDGGTDSGAPEAAPEADATGGHIAAGSEQDDTSANMAAAPAPVAEPGTHTTASAGPDAADHEDHDERRLAAVTDRANPATAEGSNHE